MPALWDAAKIILLDGFYIIRRINKYSHAARGVTSAIDTTQDVRQFAASPPSHRSMIPKKPAPGHSRPKDGVALRAYDPGWVPV